MTHKYWAPPSRGLGGICALWRRTRFIFLVSRPLFCKIR